MRLGQEKAGEFASKVWVLVLTMCSFGLSLESDMLRFVGCGMLSKSHALAGGELPPLLGISLSRGSSCQCEAYALASGVLGPFTQL